MTGAAKAKLSPKAVRKKAKATVALMKVYPNELEAQSEFDGFTEWLQTFELYRGKKSEEEFEDDGRIVGKFKVRPFSRFGNIFFFIFRILSGEIEERHLALDHHASQPCLKEGRHFIRCKSLGNNSSAYEQRSFFKGKTRCVIFMNEACKIKVAGDKVA